MCEAEPNAAFRQQRDPLGPPQGCRRQFHFRSIRFGAASVSGATRSGRLGGAAAAGRRRHRGDAGARALVANAADDVAAAAAPRRAELRGHRQSAALKDQRKRPGVKLYGADFPRARARRSRATRQQTDLLEPDGRRFANFFFESSFSRYSDFWADAGARAFGADADDDGVVAAAPAAMVLLGGAGRAQRGTGRLRYHPDRNSTELGGACSRSRNGRL